MSKGMAKRRKGKKGRNAKQEENEENVVALIRRVTEAARSFLWEKEQSLLPSQSLALETLISSLTQKPSLPPPQKEWWFRSLSDSRWLDAFRISRPSFARLLALLSPSLAPSFPHTAPDCVLAAALLRLAHAAPYSTLARRFALSPSDTCRAFFAVCKALASALPLPSPSPSPSPLPNCFGALAFARFQLHSPQNHFLVLQALVDSRGAFSHVSAGWPAALTPDSILRRSKLFHAVQESKELLNGPSCDLGDGCLIPPYVVGDSCFPLLPWLLTPYNRLNQEDSFGSAERAFNSAHQNAMRSVRDALRRLRATWRLLAISRKWKRECVEYLPFVVVAGCLLHNFLVECDEVMELKDGEEAACVEKYEPFDGVGDESAVRVRDALTLHLSRTSLRR